MDLNRLTRDADDLIRKVVSRYNQLYVPAGNISQLELDLMLDDLRKLYDTFKQIGHINLSLQYTINKTEVKVNTPGHADTQPVSSASQAYNEKQDYSSEPALTSSQPEPEPEPELISKIEPETKSESENIPETEYKSEPEPESDLPLESEAEIITEPEFEAGSTFEKQQPLVTEIQNIDKPVEEQAEISIPVNSEPAPAMLADKFNTGNKSLSETMASEQANSVMGSRILFQPISNLITGIGLNDKFSFISDLFDNNAVLYDEAITRINKAVNLDEANWILQKYHSAEWDQKKETLARLKDFVKRRFV